MITKQDLIERKIIKTEAQLKALQEYLGFAFVRRYVSDDVKTAKQKKRYGAVIET